MESEFATMADPVEVEWSTWTPAVGVPIPDEVLSGWTAFDSAFVPASPDAELAWASVHSVLGLLGDGKPKFSMVMSELEGATGPDLTFVVDKSGREGLLARWRTRTAKGIEPQLSVLLTRETGESEPSEITIWLDTGAKEGGQSTLRWRRDASWKFGQTEQLQADVDVADTSDAAQTGAVIIAGLWWPFAEEKYVDKAGRWANSETRVEPSNAGLELKDRSIDQVLSDTHFPPRLTL